MHSCSPPVVVFVKPQLCGVRLGLHCLVGTEILLVKDIFGKTGQLPNTTEKMSKNTEVEMS